MKSHRPPNPQSSSSAVWLSFILLFNRTRLICLKFSLVGTSCWLYAFTRKIRSECIYGLAFTRSTFLMVVWIHTRVGSVCLCTFEITVTCSNYLRIVVAFMQAQFLFVRVSSSLLIVQMHAKDIAVCLCSFEINVTHCNTLLFLHMHVEDLFVCVHLK